MKFVKLVASIITVVVWLMSLAYFGLLCLIWQHTKVQGVIDQAALAAQMGAAGVIGYAVARALTKITETVVKCVELGLGALFLSRINNGCRQTGQDSQEVR